MQLVVFEDAGYRNLLPLTYWRAAFDLRCGCETLIEKIEAAAGRTAESVFVRPDLAEVMKERQTRRVNQPAASDLQLWVNGRLLLRRLPDLPDGAAAWSGDTLMAARLPVQTAYRLTPQVLLDSAKLRDLLGDLPAAHIPQDAAMLVTHPWHLVLENEAEMVRRASNWRFERLGRVDPGAHLVNEAAVHLGAGSRVKPGAVLDAEDGPIFLGDEVTVYPNAVLQGPCYVGKGCVVQAGASLRRGSSIGPRCKIGGEIEDSIFHGFANKQHDGFLGHSYVGAWVNLGADTVTSDLKNTYGTVKVPVNGTLIDSGVTFVGAVIGDHSKTGINVALPTGCVIGFACNVVRQRAPRFVPSFSWLGYEDAELNDPARALAVARKVVARRDCRLTPAEEALFLSVDDQARRLEVVR